MAKISKQLGDKNREGLESFIHFIFEHPVAKADWTNEVFPVRRPKPETGKRYFVAACPNCTKVTPLLNDRTGGKMLPPHSEGGVRTECYFCDETLTAHWRDVHSIEWT